MLITDLAKIETLQVVERARIQALLDEMALGASGLVDPHTAPRVGRLMGATYLVGGRLVPADQSGIRIDSDLVRVMRRDNLGRPTSAGPFEELLRMEKEILFEIVRLLQLELSPAQLEMLRKPLTNNMKALMAFFQGIQNSDQQKYAQAAEAYQEAVEADPEFATAIEALEELYRLNLISHSADTLEVLERLHQRVSVNDNPEPDDIVPHPPRPPVRRSAIDFQW